MIDKFLFPWEDESGEKNNNQQDLGKEDVYSQLPPTDQVLFTETKDESKEMWLAMERYHKMGLSMIWGRAEKQIIGKRTYEAKTPLTRTWSSNPEDRLSLEYLANMMAKHATIKISPIIICGKASGNLIVIDIDIKHWPGIDTKFFKAIQDIYPELWKKLRIHKTPSGGYHIFYYTVEFVDIGNKKLAYAKDSKEAGIELRAHGGYVMAPPGMGYTVHQDVPVPTISVEDHERLIDLAKLLSERIKIKQERATKKYENIYDENPYYHFNSSPAAEEVLTRNGWEVFQETEQFIHFTRPGKDNGVSASFKKYTRMYHIFSTSTDLDGDENYTPSFLRGVLEHDGDSKKLYPILVKEGFGKHKAKYEEKVIRKAAESGKPLPPNFSKEAQEQLKTALDQKKEKYPHGIFWEFIVNSDSFRIHRLLLKNFLHSLGLRLYHGEPCVIEGQYIRKLEESKKKNGCRDVYNLLFSWIKEEEEDVFKEISHEFDKFWQSSGEHTITTLSLLDESLLLKSNPQTSYKCFRDKVVCMSKGGHEVLPIISFSDKLIWRDEIIDHEFKYMDAEGQKTSMFCDFVTKGLEGNIHYLQTIFGFLCCDYKVSSESYAIMLGEPSDPSKGGGTGKGFLGKMFGLWTPLLVTNGQAVKKDVDQLIQNWNGEKLVHLSDLPKWVNLSDLKHIISDDSQRKLLYKDIQNVAVEDMPKFLMSGQFGLNVVDDGGVRRRIRQISFSGYFHGDDSIRSEYGGDCPGVWDKGEREGCNDWDGFFSFLVDSVVLYHKVRKIEIVENMGLWLKGFDARFSSNDSYLREAMEEVVESWSSLEYVTSGQVNEWYELLCKRSGIGMRGRISSTRRLYEAFKEYGEKMGLYEFESGKRELIDCVRQRVVKVTRLGKVDNPEEKSASSELGPEWDQVNDIQKDSEGEEELPF